MMNAADMGEIEVRLARADEGRALVALSRQAFGRSALGMWRAMGSEGVTLVAALGDRLVGFGCFIRVVDVSDEGELERLLHCLRPPLRGLLAPLPYDPLQATSVREEVAMVVTAPPGVAPTVEVGDCVLTALYVDPRLRHRGLGTTLARRRLELAAAVGARQAFVHCIEGSGSAALYQKLGFEPLLHVAHHYEDGRGMTLLHRPIAA